MYRGLKRILRATILASAILLPIAQPGIAQNWLAPAYPDQAVVGPSHARGVVVWSHGRSVTTEDSEAPTPPYMQIFQDGGWDVLRYNRMRGTDTLANSSRDLVRLIGELKQQGYRRVVLAGQSFGAFISLIAAGLTDEVEAIVATAPAAYGSFSDAYESWRNNADRFYPLLRNVRNARVMLFFFHGDDFDPGGRADMARAILSDKKLPNIVIDQPAALVGHGAAGTGLFVRRFGNCMLRFAEQRPAADDPACDQKWGQSPSAQLPVQNLPGSTSSLGQPTETSPFLGRWYGFYINGREVLLSVERIEGNKVSAEYVLGPGLVPGQKGETVRRQGRIDGDTLIFDELEKNPLRYEVRRDGKLTGTWSARNGTAKLEAVMRRIG